MKKCISAEDILKYATSSQDTAAIHLNDEAAAKAGYNRPIVHGMYMMGLAQSLYLAEHQSQWITTYSMKFQKPVLVDSIITFDYESCEDKIQVTIAFETGEVIAVGTFSVKEGL